MPPTAADMHGTTLEDTDTTMDTATTSARQQDALTSECLIAGIAEIIAITITAMLDADTMVETATVRHAQLLETEDTVTVTLTGTEMETAMGTTTATAMGITTETVMEASAETETTEVHSEVTATITVFVEATTLQHSA